MNKRDSNLSNRKNRITTFIGYNIFFVLVNDTWIYLYKWYVKGFAKNLEATSLPGFLPTQSDFVLYVCIHTYMICDMLFDQSNGDVFNIPIKRTIHIILNILISIKRKVF